MSTAAACSARGRRAHEVFTAWAKMSAAAASAVRIRWAYTRRVIAGSAWPGRAATTCTGTRDSSKVVACPQGRQGRPFRLPHHVRSWVWFDLACFQARPSAMSRHLSRRAERGKQAGPVSGGRGEEWLRLPTAGIASEPGQDQRPGLGRVGEIDLGVSLRVVPFLGPTSAREPSLTTFQTPC